MSELPAALGRALAVIACLVFVIAAYVLNHFAQSIPPGPRGQVPFKGIDSMRCIEIVGYLQKYAVDHKGRFPEGKTSTEVFQHLIDEKYVDYPTMFCKADTENDLLDPGNVMWDVTCCVDSSAPNGLPLVFLTGYKVTYLAGSSAVPLKPPRKTWTGWWNRTNRPFMAAVFAGYLPPLVISSTKTWDEVDKNYSIGEVLQERSQTIFDADDDGTIPNFIPADFDAKGKTYRQLTP